MNLSGKLYRVVSYGLDAGERIDYDAAQRLALEEKPRMIVTGASAYSRVIDWQRFRAIADQCGALLMADIAHYAGLVAAGLYPSPVGIADFVTTTTHKTLRGPRGGLIARQAASSEKAINSAIFPGLQGGPLMHVIAAKAVAFGEALRPEFKAYQQQRARQRARHGARRCRSAACASSPAAPTATCSCSICAPRTSPARTPRTLLGRAHITVNKNAIPNDPAKPTVTSGIRIGSPAMTTRGFGAGEAEKVADLIADVLEDPKGEHTLQRVTREVKALCAKFPVYI